MKKRIVLILSLVLLLTACTPQDTPAASQTDTGPTAAPTASVTEPEITEATEPTLSEEEAQAILQARRDIVEAEMRYMMSVLWRCDTDISYKYRNLRAGYVYSGIPFAQGHTATEGFLAYGQKDEKGVYNLTGFTAQNMTGGNSTSMSHSARIGTNCLSALFWSWAKVSTSIDFNNTFAMTEQGGCIKVGNYVCDEVAHKDTTQTVQANGEKTMFEAYMQLQKGDALVMYDGASGHTIMFVDIHVEYTADGRIDAENSYCLVHEQGGGGDQDGKTYYDETLGETVYRIGSTDNKYTFRKLFDKGYLPITCKELIDPSPLEAPVVMDSLDECTIEKLYFGEISSNYRISHVTVTITDEAGKEVQSCTCYVRQEEKYAFKMKSFITDSILGVVRGELDTDALPAGRYTCTVSCYIATGDTFMARQFEFSK